MKHTIKRIPIDEISYDEFVSEYLMSEKPVILTGIDMYDENDITSETVKRHFKDESKRNIGWYEAPIAGSEKLIPPLVQQLLARQDMSVRPLAMRLFMQPNGHKTLYHYDGNSLHGFNLQIKGRKHWYLVSPFTPLPSAPLMFVSLVGRDFNPTNTTLDNYEFETHPGEMLFLPRYWIHSVSTIEAENINYNWVMTPTYPETVSPLGKRESELLFLRKKLPFINRFLVDSYGEYGGGGKVIVENYIQDVGYGRMLLRILKELALVPKTLLLKKEIMSMAHEFETNNFNV